MTKSTLIGLISIVLITGCINPAEHQYLPVLAEAELLAETAPDSAFRLLQSIEYPEELSERDFAQWCLISGTIFNRRTDQEKTFLPSLSFERASQYYQQEGTTEQQAFIRLYLGRSYQIAGDYDRAIQIYAEVLKDAEAWKEYNAAGTICSYMGDVYQTQYLSDKSKEKYYESIYFFNLINDPKSIAYVYAELGFEYLYDDKSEEGLNYILQADSIAQLIQEAPLRGKICYYLGVAYSELNNFATAEQYLQKALQFTRTKADSIVIYYAINNIYIAANDYPKAREVLERGTSNLTKDGILHQLYLIEKGEQHYKQALTYLEQYQEVLDSIQTEQKRTHTLEIERKYNLEHAENQKNRALVVAQRNYIIALVAVAIALLMLFIHQIMLRRKNRIILQQREELTKADLVVAEISQKLKQEEEVQQKLHEALKKLNLDSTAALTEQQQYIDGIKEEFFFAKLEKIRSASAIGKKITKIAERVTPGGKALSPAEWQGLKELVLETYPVLDALLSNRTNPLTDTELRLSLLTFFNLGAKGESIILDIMPDSVYKQRTRLRQKLYLEEGANVFEFVKKYCIENE